MKPRNVMMFAIVAATLATLAFAGPVLPRPPM